MAEVQFQPLEAPERLADMVYETIRQSIMDKTLAPGARLTESGLAAQLGVSKTPVREALLRLRRIGVIRDIYGLEFLRFWYLNDLEPPASPSPDVFLFFFSGKTIVWPALAHRH